MIDLSEVEKMKKFLKLDKTPREKLDFVDKTAKEFFKDAYGLPLNSGYSTLIQEFEKKRKKNELAFCKAMFATYYSHKALSENRAIALGSLLIDIERGKKRADEISRMPGFMERIERFFDMRRKINGKKKILRKEARRSRKLELKRAAKRQSDLRVVKKREKVISKEKVVAMKIKAKVAKKSENKKKRLIGKRTRVLRKQNI